MRLSVVLLISVGAFVLVGCSETPEEPGSGTILAVATDPQVGPVADVEVTLVPENLRMTTDQNGLVIFVVPAGDYFVDATLCCIGPGTQYHVPVTVREGETVRVELGACLTCR